MTLITNIVLDKVPESESSKVNPALWIEKRNDEGVVIGYYNRETHEVIYRNLQSDVTILFSVLMCSPGKGRRETKRKGR